VLVAGGDGDGLAVGAGAELAGEELAGATEVCGALELGEGGLLVEAGAVGVVEASGSTYCWFPADCASAAGARSTTSAAQSARAPHTLRRLNIV
jgi:hypothetical protein